MATQNQRTLRAPCPGCGAPVEFRSAASTHAVCSYCQSTVVRDGDTLSRIGKMAELFDDHSPLQLMAAGQWQGRSFTLVGRLQYKGESGQWTEWIALFADGSEGILSEDNGSYVLALSAEPGRDLPDPSKLKLGSSIGIAGKTWQVAATGTARLMSAQGELPKLPQLFQDFDLVELRASDGEVLSIDYGAQPPQVTRGVEVRLEDLKLTGLKNESVKETTGRQFSCPNCGAQVEVKLDSTKSITCRACNTIIDLSQGIGGQLAHALQDEPIKPLIPLGSVGLLQGVQWQVVGYQHRLGTEAEDPDEHFGWDEYLLYNQKRGFMFLVDATDGWSLVKPVTGAPRFTEGGSTAEYLGRKYRLDYRYRAQTNYVAGEFYWPVARGQTSGNIDFSSGKSILSLEQTAKERTWSLGSRIDSDVVATAFRMEGKKDLLKRSDTGPAGGAAGIGCGTLFILLIVVVFIILAVKSCNEDCDPSRENCSSGSGYRSSGGSYGGYSSGGSHK